MQRVRAPVAALISGTGGQLPQYERLIENLGLPLGRLPGDIRMRGEGWSFNFPIVTSVVVSIVLTVLLNLLLWFFRR